MMPTHAHQQKCAESETATGHETWLLRLYVAGQSPKSVAALTNLRRICEEDMDGMCQLEVVDILENPQLAVDDQILAVPALVRRLPPPMRKIIGDLSKTDRVLIGLDFRHGKARAT